MTFNLAELSTVIHVLVIRQWPWEGKKQWTRGPRTWNPFDSGILYASQYFYLTKILLLTEGMQCFFFEVVLLGYTYVHYLHKNSKL